VAHKFAFDADYRKGGIFHVNPPITGLSLCSERTRVDLAAAAAGIHHDADRT
jgi:hypothetical protein